MTLTAPVTLRVASVVTTSEWPIAEKPSPPYSFGMTMPRNFCSLMYCQTSGGRSLSS